MTIWVKLIGPGASPTYEEGNSWQYCSVLKDLEVCERKFEKKTVSKMHLKKTHHVVGLAVADWPSNSLQHLSIKVVIYGVLVVSR